METSKCTCEDAAIGGPAPLVFREIHCGPPSHQPKLDAQRTSSDGRHWKHVLVDLGAVKIQSYYGRLLVTPVSKAKVASTREFESSVSCRWWVLHANELLLGVDVCVGDDAIGGGIVGIRLTTTERESPWYGTCVGARVERFVAPTHFFINGLFSSLVDNVHVSFGVRIEPTNRLAHHGVCDRDDELQQSSCCPLICSPLVTDDGNPDVHAFCESHFHLRAIVVRWNAAPRAIQRVDILSASQYERMKAANHEGQCHARLAEPEEILVLSEGEEIIAVDVKYACSESNTVSDDYVLAVRFKTTRSPFNAGHWVGDAGSSYDKEDRIVTHDARRVGLEKTKVTGFCGAYNSKTRQLVTLQPVYHQVAP
jgi:hypothetical protein